MKAKDRKIVVLVVIVIFFFVISPLVMAENEDDNDDNIKKNNSFVHGVVIKVDGKRYYFGGVADTANNATDVPGHSWVQINKRKIIGYHKNTGPFGAPRWWSSDAEDGALLYVVEAKIDTWSEIKAAIYFAQGFTHHHHLVSVKTGKPHPNKVAWLKHVAVSDFVLDGGPHPELAHEVSPGVDFRFVPNWQMPYSPMHHMP